MAWTINPTVTVNGVSYNSNAVGNLTIDYGRANVWQPQQAGYARIQLLNLDNTAFAIDINQTVVVQLKDYAGTTDKTVFTGKVTNIDNGVVLFAGTTTVASVTITAVAPLSVLARTQVSLTDYPSETDNARITRIFSECGVTVDALDDAVYTYSARPASPNNALSLANYYSLMATGAIYETKDGKVGYDSQYSRSTDVLANGYFAIDPSLINWANLKSAVAIGDLLNSINLEYSSGAVSVENTSSQASYGVMEQTIKTEIVSSTDATALANLYLAMRAYPKTSLTSIDIRLDDPDITSTTVNKMLDIYFGLPISITGAPTTISDGIYYGFVEGWNLSFNQIAARITLRTSNKTYSYRPTVWQAVPAGQTWATTTATTAWKDYE